MTGPRGILRGRRCRPSRCSLPVAAWSDWAIRGFHSRWSIAIRARVAPMRTLWAAQNVGTRSPAPAVVRRNCAYRGSYHELQRLGATVYGLSTQTTDYQREAVSRLQLPFSLMSDSLGEFSASLRLPWFEVEGLRLLKRLTLIIGRGRILHGVYPVF